MNIGNKHNSDDVFSRAVIVGLINMLNNKIQYENYISNDDRKDVIEVPWFFNQAGDERFMQDFFVHWNDCIHPKLATGNYDIVPRGIITLSGENIDTNSLTNRFIRATYVKEINGELQTFSAYLNSIPLICSYECSIETDSYLDAMKIRQVIIETFFATQVFHVSYKGVKVPCQVGFPTTYGLEKTFEYTYGDDTKVMINFDLEMQTFQPVFDKSSERHNSNRMFNISKSVKINEPTTIEPNISIKEPISNDLFYSGQQMKISWESIGTMLNVNIFYELESSGEWVPIENGIINTGSYIWDVPNFQNQYASCVLSQIGKEKPNIKIFINGLGELEEVHVLNGGLGFDNDLKITIEENKEGITPAIVNPIINNGSIERVEIISPGSGYTPMKEFDLKIKVENTTNNSIFDQIDNIKVR